jgi:alpha-glucosidase
VNATSGANTTLSAPLGHINVHFRDGSAILLHAKPAYTVTETREGPFSLLISLDTAGSASGSAYLDDGVSFPIKSSKTLTFSASHGNLKINPTGSFKVAPALETVTILGVKSQPRAVTINGKNVAGFKFLPGQQELVVEGLSVNLNNGVEIQWK